MDKIKNSKVISNGSGSNSALNLETTAERRTRWQSILVVYSTIFLQSLGYSITLTGVWPYAKKVDKDVSLDLYGYILAANPFAQMISSPLFGWWTNRRRSSRVPLVVTMFIFAFASTMYATLSLFPPNRTYWMIVARLLVGVSSANIAICRSYLSAATTVDERTTVVSMGSLSQVVGFVIGAGLQAAVTPLGDKGYDIFGGKLQIDMYTVPGWINVGVAILNGLILLPWCFKERPIAAKEAMVVQRESSEEKAISAYKIDLVSAWTLIGAFFVLVLNFVILEVLGTPLLMEQFAMLKKDALRNISLLTAVGAVISCISFILLGPLSKRFDERKILIWGSFFLMVLGRIAYFPWSDELPQIKYNETSYAFNGTKLGFNETLLDFNGRTLFFNGTAIDFDGNALAFNKSAISSYQHILGLNITEIEEVGCPVQQDWCQTTHRLTMFQFLLGFALTAIAYPIGATLIQTILSKVLGPHQQGVWMGLFTGSGSFSRVVGPIFLTLIYKNLGLIWTFGLMGTIMAVTVVWLLLVKHKLVPANVEKEKDAPKLPLKQSSLRSLFSCAICRVEI